MSYDGREVLRIHSAHSADSLAASLARRQRKVEKTKNRFIPVRFSISLDMNPSS